MSDEIVIVSAARTPIGKFQGAYKDIPATTLGAFAVKAAVERAGVNPEVIDECVMGNVIGAGLGQSPARQAALGAGLPNTVGGLTINKVCGSGLKSVMLASAMLANGDARVIVAGGLENMTRGPYLLPQARAGYRAGNAEIIDATMHDGLWCAFEQQPMGNSAEWIARAYGVSREDQDAFAFESHRRAVAAQDAGLFDAEIVPVEIALGKGKSYTLSADEPPRRDTDLEKLARLRPAFEADGTVTAGNAPGITDGAAALVLTTASFAEANGLKPLARIAGSGQAGVKPLEIFAAPPLAIQNLLARTNTSIDDYDLFELNEAFAAQAVANIRTAGIDPEKVNVNGGAIALGHPIGASGARVLVTLLNALQQRGGKRGIASLCLGGGEAVALAIELV